ncbi:MAG: hypothetical protein ACO3JG_01340 [Luteolibacter sp.]
MVSPSPDSSSELTRTSLLETADLRDAHTLLHQFDALALGEGSLNAGANTLTAMALALANIAPPGTCITDKEGTRIVVGMNLLVSGSLSCGIIDDRVMEILQDLQNNVFAHIRQRLERKRQREELVTEITRASVTRQKEEKVQSRIVMDRLEKNEFMTNAMFEAEWRSLLRPPLDPEISELTEAPVFFAGIGSVESLYAAVKFANRGRLLAHASLSADQDTPLLARVCGELVSGCPRRKLLAASIRGEVVATDPRGILGNLLVNDAQQGWLERMLWLSDHGDGPVFERNETDAKAPRMQRIGGWFRLAAEEVAATRLNIHKPGPIMHKLPIAAMQAEWVHFLQGLEPRFPGIAGTLRPLLASLTFGLLRITSAVPVENQVSFSMKQVAALSRLLALRMVEHRERLLSEARRRMIESIIAKLRLKLADGPQTVRDLVRRFDKLDAAICVEALVMMADSGQAVLRGNRWQLTERGGLKTLTTIDV